MSKLRRRYPGVTPFETFQADQYFGRQRDVQDLYDLILLEKIVVLFGKSGYGKSSLLNAGIIPKMIEHKAVPGGRFVPIVIKFATYTKDTLYTPIAAVKGRLTVAKGLPEPVPTGYLTENGESLWFEFKRQQKTDFKIKFVLIFDQFEEFFTYPHEEQVQFREQLAELLFTEIPQSIRERWDNLIDSEKEFLSEELNVRAVFAIREDRLSWLNSMKEDLPAILNKRYELKGLTDGQAKEAIRKPASLPQKYVYQESSGKEMFECHAFTYSEQAEEILLDELKKGGRNTTDARQQESRIEAFLLQICCENIESRLIERAKDGDVHTLISPQDLPRFDRIYEEYYNNKINELPEDQREVAKRLIEDELINFNEVTGVVFRLNADGRKLCTKPGVTEDLLKKLTDAFLLRSEPNTTGGFNYEISHDTLVKPVLKAKEIRGEEEKRMLMTKEKAEREKELARERQKRRKATIAATTGIMLAIFAIAVSIYALQLRNQALLAQQEAEKAKIEAQAAQKTAEERLKELQKEKAQGLVRDGDSFFQNDEYSFALDKYQKALKLVENDPEIAEKIKICKLRLGID